MTTFHITGTTGDNVYPSTGTATGSPLSRPDIQVVAEDVAAVLGRHLIAWVTKPRPAGELKDIAVAYGVAMDKVTSLRQLALQTPPSAE